MKWVNNRPENWGKYRPELLEATEKTRKVYDKGVEAGADAMLEALKEDAYLCIPNDQYYLLTKWHHPDTAMGASKELNIKVYPERKGWLVFIEDID